MSQNQQRKTFTTLKTKVYVGEKSTKSINIHFGRNDKDKMLDLATNILRGIQYGSDLDITVFIRKNRENKISPVTVTARVRRN